MNTNWIKAAFAVIGGGIALYIGLASPFPDLSPQGTIALAVFVAAVVLWVVDYVPDYVTGMGMLVAWALFKAVPFSKSFEAFSSATVWLIVGAFMLALAIEKSGLLKRIALTLMTFFPMTYRGQTTGMFLTSLLITPLVPAGSSKGAMLGILSKTISDNMGYERTSKGACGLFASMVVPVVLISPGILSATFLNYTILGMLPEKFQNMTWTMWFVAASVWTLIITVSTFIFIQIYYKPADAKKVGDKSQLYEEKKKLGHMTRNEYITVASLVFCFTLWIFEKSVGISSAVVTLTACFMLYVTKVLDRNDFKTKIPWDLLFFISAIICCGPVFKATGIDSFFALKLSPFITPFLEGNFIVFIILYSILIYLVKFIIVSQTALLTIFVLGLSPIVVSLGFNPWILGFITYTANIIWITKYQNPTFIPILAIVSGGVNEKPLVTYKQTVPLSIFYMIVTIVGYICSIPLWRMLGYLPG